MQQVKIVTDMRRVVFGLCLTGIIALGAMADEPVPDGAKKPAAGPEASSEEAADADIRRIEDSVSGKEEVKEFIPKRPLSADKAIALPSDI